MPLAPGARVGFYDVIGLIGAGGMGEVYRARDTRLNRDVALKIVPESFASDPDRVARFAREAQVLASLNHPNIAAIYGLEESDGQRALVLELVEGPTLADRLAQGPIDLGEALEIARQISDALDAAHERGVIHRDLKPANVKVRADGTVKVLDFGLAKALSDNVAANDASQSPTITSPAMTRMGTILGTAAYMSPEQARGRTVDKRTDLWSFGAVLYEMLTARRAFPGDDVTDSLAAVLRGEPDWQALPAGTPSGIRRLLRRCLEKDRASRLADAADARLEIRDARTDDAEVATSRRGWSRLAWALVAALGVVCVVLAALLVRSEQPTDNDAFYRSVILPPAGDVNLASAEARTSRPMRLGHGLALSPDGRRLALVAPGPNGRLMLWVHPLDGSGAHVLAGTDDAASPFWSFDGRYLAFVADSKLKRIAAAGGPVAPLYDGATDLSTGTWNHDNVILFAAHGSIYRVSAEGRDPSPVTKRDETRENPHDSPFFLPDGRHFLYGVGLGSGSRTGGGVFVGSLDSTAGTKLVDGGYLPAYANGFLLFVREDMLMAQRFDADRLTLAGDPAPLAEHLPMGGAPTTRGVFAVAHSGVLVYQDGPVAKSELLWLDRNGHELGALGEPGGFSYVQLSPDQQQVAVSVVDEATRTRDVWVYDTTRSARTRVTYESSDDFAAVWAPKGNRVAFAGRRADDRLLNIYETSPGVGGEKRLLDRDGVEIPTSWSPDGHFLLYQTPAPSSDIMILSLAEGHAVSGFATTPFTEGSAQFSPDGRWVAYSSNETDRTEVYVAPFQRDGRRVPVSTGGGGSPRWCCDGKELFYIRADNTLMAVAITATESSIAVGAAQPLFAARFQGTAFPYDVSADGSRFIVNRSVGDATPPPITLIVNWPAMLKK